MGTSSPAASSRGAGDRALADDQSVAIRPFGLAPRLALLVKPAVLDMASAELAKYTTKVQIQHLRSPWPEDYTGLRSQFA
jgi:hypothetical protein